MRLKHKNMIPATEVPATSFGKHRFINNAWSFPSPYICLQSSNVFLWADDAKIYSCSPDIITLSSSSTNPIMPFFLLLKSFESILSFLPDNTHSHWHLHASSGQLQQPLYRSSQRHFIPIINITPSRPSVCFYFVFVFFFCFFLAKNVIISQFPT